LRYYIGEKREYDLDLAKIVAFLSLILERGVDHTRAIANRKIIIRENIGTKDNVFKKTTRFY
jgi:hypothetical protein